MHTVTCKVDNQGRITLPVEWRKEQGVEAGSEVIVSPGEDGLRVQTMEQSLHEARQIVSKYRRGRSSAVSMLRTGRKREAELEKKEAARYVKGPR